MAKDNTYSQPVSNPPQMSAANGQKAKGMEAPSELTYSNSDPRPNGAGASARDQANNELTSRKPPFDVSPKSLTTSLLSQTSIFLPR